jgi:hypothetical protein
MLVCMPGGGGIARVEHCPLPPLPDPSQLASLPGVVGGGGLALMLDPALLSSRAAAATRASGVLLRDRDDRGVCSGWGGRGGGGVRDRRTGVLMSSQSSRLQAYVVPSFL